MDTLTEAATPPAPDRAEAQDVISGTCFCGAVAIAVTGTPEEMGYCHCASCRAHSGAPMTAFTLWKTDQVRVTRGADRLGGFNSAGFSNRRFCTRCGGQVMVEHPGFGLTDVPPGVVSGLRFLPAVHLNYREAVLPARDGLPKFADFPTSPGGSGELRPE
jgi:hypothetical protein